MRIGERQIGPDHPPYVIAEIGVNHDGSPERALELTRLAANAGADAVKFQLFEADRLMSRAAKLAAYQKAAGENDPIEMLRRLELSIDELAPCVEELHRLGIHAIVSIFSVELVSVAERLAWDAYKSASPDIINKPLLEAMAATGKPLIVSTGASTLEEVVRAAGWLEHIQDRLVLLQCVSCYPTDESSAELDGIAAIRTVFNGPVGYSDHTRTHRMSGVAVAAGACVLEKHFTDDRHRTGPDHLASLEPWGMTRYVEEARTTHTHRPAAVPDTLPEFVARMKSLKSADERTAMDNAFRCRNIDPRKRVLAIELDVREVSRQSLVAVRSLPAGHVLARENITIKRPGIGLAPYELDAVLGSRLAHAVEADSPLTMRHLPVLGGRRA